MSDVDFYGGWGFIVGFVKDTRMGKERRFCEGNSNGKGTKFLCDDMLVNANAGSVASTCPSQKGF